MRDIFLKLMLNTHKKCMNFIVTYHFYLKERNLKVEKLATNLHDKNECYTHKQFKTGIKSWLSFEKVHRVIKFNQKDCIKPYIVMNNELGQKSKKQFRERFFYINE